MSEKSKSIKAIRRMRKKDPQLVEDAKKTLIIRGNKTSNSVIEFLKDIRSLRKQRSVLFSRKHQIYPFENHRELEEHCQKTEASLFLFGSHSKKRPNNIVLGRTYQHKVLDSVELGLNNFQSISSLVDNCQIPIQCRPFLVFQGDIWESDEIYKKLRNLFNDFFFQNNKVEGIDLNNVMKVLMVFTVTENEQQQKKIFMNVYEATIKDSEKVLQEVDQGRITLQELGPNAEFTVRRHQFADPEQWKKATYVPKPKKKKAKKNILYDNMGNERRKLYIDRQDLKSLVSKKRKLIRKEKDGVTRQKLREDKNEDQFAN